MSIYDHSLNRLDGSPLDLHDYEDKAVDYETAVVEAGTVTLLIDDARHELRAGDSVTFDADLPHHFENHGKEEAALLAVVSAGLRRS